MYILTNSYKCVVVIWTWSTSHYSLVGLSLYCSTCLKTYLQSYDEQSIAMIIFHGNCCFIWNNSAAATLFLPRTDSTPLTNALATETTRSMCVIVWFFTCCQSIAAPLFLMFLIYLHIYIHIYIDFFLPFNSFQLMTRWRDVFCRHLCVVVIIWIVVCYCFTPCVVFS